MKAIVNPKGGFKASHRKESKFQREVTGFDTLTFRPIVTLRFYETDAQTYCCVWVNIAGASGSYAAGGGGYHKRSAAAQHAFLAAGITFDENFDGGGDYAIEEAVKAIGNALGFNLFVHTAHP